MGAGVVASDRGAHHPRRSRIGEMGRAEELADGAGGGEQVRLHRRDRRIWGTAGGEGRVCDGGELPGIRIRRGHGEVCAACAVLRPGAGTIFAGGQLLGAGEQPEE